MCRENGVKIQVKPLGGGGGGMPRMAAGMSWGPRHAAPGSARPQCGAAIATTIPGALTSKVHVSKEVAVPKKASMRWWAPCMSTTRRCSKGDGEQDDQREEVM